MEKEVYIFMAGEGLPVTFEGAQVALTEMVNQGWMIITSHGERSFLCVILQRSATEQPNLNTSATDLSDAD